MQRETETEETVGFRHIFMIGGISIVEGMGQCPPPPLATPMHHRARS